jgi:Uma2 family endonuclease
VVVTRAPLDLDLQHFPEPVLIAEVVGPEEGGHDFGTKLPDYRMIPSLREILLVSSRERRAEHWRREGDRHWLVRDLIGERELRLEIADSAIPLAAVYGNVPVW